MPDEIPEKKPKVTKPRVPRVAKPKTASVRTATVRVTKKATPSAAVEAKETKSAHALEYLYGKGGRKRAGAIVRLFPNGTGKIEINERPFVQYFAQKDLQGIVQAPLALAGMKDTVDVVARAHGGGLRGQATGLQLAIARAIIKLKSELRPSFRAHGFLTRDARKKERKKYGLKKARRAPQWKKR